MKWFKVISTVYALVFVSFSYFTQCSGAPPTSPSRSLAQNSTKAISLKCTPLVRCMPSKPKVFPATAAVAAALADLLKTAVGPSNEHQHRPNHTLHQIPEVLRIFARFIGIVVSPPSPPSSTPITPTPSTSTEPPTTPITPTPSTSTEPPTTPTQSTTYETDDSATTQTVLPTTPTDSLIACPPTTPQTLKKLMSLFVPVSAIPSSPTARPSSVVTLPKLFRKSGTLCEESKPV